MADPEHSNQSNGGQRDPGDDSGPGSTRRGDREAGQTLSDGDLDDTATELIGRADSEMQIGPG